MTILDHRHKWLTRSQLMRMATGLSTDFVDEIPERSVALERTLVSAWSCLSIHRKLAS